MDQIPLQIKSPEQLPPELFDKTIYWQGRLIKLNGDIIEHDPITQLKNELDVLWSYEFSSDNRFLAYQFDEVFQDDTKPFSGFPVVHKRIGLWNLETNEKKILVNADEDFSADVSLGGIAFTPADDQILFMALWRDSKGKQRVDLAIVEIPTKTIELLEIDSLPAQSLGINISPDGNSVVLDGISVLNDQACLLVNLQHRNVQCLATGPGNYLSSRFSVDGEYIIFSRSFQGKNNIYRSKIDGTEITLLASGFARLDVLFTTNHDVVFSGATFENYECSNIYAINIDGENLIELSYLGNQCETPFQ